MKRKTKFSKRSTRSRLIRKRSTRKRPVCSWKFFGGNTGNTVRQTIYSTGNPNVALSQEGAKASLTSMNNMMK